MIKSITVTNYLNESITMELANPEKSGFQVRKIEGLGPCKADINSTEMATSDGSIYNSARVTSRNIVITLGLLFNPTVEDSRQKTYKYFPIKKQVKLLIETDNRSCATYGYVESNEPDMFSSDETAQISIVCNDPYFYSAAESKVIVFSGSEGSFEFAFSNESLTTDLIELGSLSFNEDQNVYYSGDAETGVNMIMSISGEVKNVTIYNVTKNEKMSIDTSRLESGSFLTGDEITICTVRGHLSVMLLRNGIYTNIINCLGKKPVWFQLSKGDNIFAYVAETGTTNVQFRIEHNILYEGV